MDEIDVHPAPFLDDVYLKELYDGRRPSLGRVFAFYSERLHYLVKAKEFDVVWIEKEVLPWVPGWVERTVVGSLPSVVDFDDAWHLRYSRSPNPLVRWTLGKKLERMARRANFVIVANKFLQSWAEDAGATSVTCIPTVVDLRRYPQTTLPAPEPFTIGWIGTPETAPYLDTIKGALQQVLAKENTRLLLIGASPPSCRFPTSRPSPGRRRGKPISCSACMSASCRCRKGHGSTGSPATSSCNTWRRAGRVSPLRWG